MENNTARETLLWLTVLCIQNLFPSLIAQELLPSKTAVRIVEQTQYTLSYVESHEQVEWIAYKLTNAILTNILVA